LGVDEGGCLFSGIGGINIDYLGDWCGFFDEYMGCIGRRDFVVYQSPYSTLENGFGDDGFYRSIKGILSR